MKQSRFKEHQILKILKEVESGIAVADVSRTHGVSGATIYGWRAKYGGMTEAELKRLRHLEAENNKLKRMYADVCLDNQILKDILEKKL